MGRLVHTSLGSSYLIAHVLHCPPPPPHTALSWGCVFGIHESALTAVESLRIVRRFDVKVFICVTYRESNFFKTFQRVPEKYTKQCYARVFLIFFLKKLPRLRV